MPSTTLSAGEPIKARCTKCRKNTDHIIVVMGDEAPVKVECTMCGRQHKYRPPTAAKKRAVKKTVQPVDAERKEWQKLRPDMDEEKATDYSMTSSYEVHSLINHPVFGLGVVQRVVGPRKVEVLFEDGKKTMRCK
jgi:Zn ribbon nucleic-acid-binding protein